MVPWFWHIPSRKLQHRTGTPIICRYFSSENTTCLSSLSFLGKTFPCIMFGQTFAVKDAHSLLDGFCRVSKVGHACSWRFLCQIAVKPPFLQISGSSQWFFFKHNSWGCWTIVMYPVSICVYIYMYIVYIYIYIHVRMYICTYIDMYT